MCLCKMQLNTLAHDTKEAVKVPTRFLARVPTLTVCRSEVQMFLLAVSKDDCLKAQQSVQNFHQLVVTHCTAW